MFTMKIKNRNDLCDEFEFEKNFDTEEQLFDYIMPLMVDFARNDYDVRYEVGRMEITSASMTILYTWEEHDPKLKALANRGHPFDKKD